MLFHPQSCPFPAPGRRWKSRPGWQRLLAQTCALSFAWTFVLSLPVQALTHSTTPDTRSPTPYRLLTPDEMSRCFGSVTNTVPQAGTATCSITGTQTASSTTWDIVLSGSVIATDASPNGWSVSPIGSSPLSVSAPGSASVGTGYTARYKGMGANRSADFDVVHPATSVASGSSYPWERGVPSGGGSPNPIAPGSTNTINGNKLTALPIVGWTARGGLPVSLSLVHNSQSNQNLTLGYKWTHSYDLYLLVDGSGNVTVHWGDDLAYTFTRNINGTYTAPTGIYDTLVKNANNTYTLTTKHQVTYQFNTSLRCTSISDTNGNSLSLSYTGNNLTTLTDPSGRTLTFAYTGNRITSLTDPQSRVWTLSYDGSGNLQTVTFPTVGGNSYTVNYTYNANHCLTDIQTPRGYHWTYGYNADNSLAWEKDPYNNQTSFAYTSVITVTDPNGNASVYTYTSSRVTQVKDALTYHDDYQYDTANNVTQVDIPPIF